MAQSAVSTYHVSSPLASSSARFWLGLINMFAVCIDDFICDTCFAHGLNPSTLPPGYDPAYADYGQLRHVYTHPLVRCRRKEASAAVHEPVTESSVEETGTETDRRLASVEKRLLAMDAKFERFESRFDNLEKQIARLEKKQDSMQDALLERFAETLANVLERTLNVNGQALNS